MSVVEARTNEVHQSCTDATCNCDTMWSLAQQFSCLRLSENSGDFKARLIRNYAVRARRIAATYARFYLETEVGGDASKKGRFYWMALGAFASKTVACTLEAWQVKTQAMMFKDTKEGLGKGNLWLFCDISGWHWYYSNHPSSFDACIKSRNSKNYVKAVKQQVEKMPWSTAALPKINYMSVSKEIKAGFSKVKIYETETNPKKKESLQLAHLLDIADHEQGVILQPLIYEDPDFSFWVRLQRKWYVNWATPNLELVFNHACSTDHDEVKSEAPSDTVLESFRSRMSWISSAANQFHKLMRTQKNHMENEIRLMAGWVTMADK